METIKKSNSTGKLFLRIEDLLSRSTAPLCLFTIERLGWAILQQPKYFPKGD